jgi:uncharacterized membrane protein YjgN (DUF898 family)
MIKFPILFVIFVAIVALLAVGVVVSAHATEAVAGNNDSNNNNNHVDMMERKFFRGSLVLEEDGDRYDVVKVRNYIFKKDI